MPSDDTKTVMVALVALVAVVWWSNRNAGGPSLTVKGDIGGTKAASVPEALVALEEALSVKKAKQPSLQAQFNDNYADRSGDGSLRMIANYLFS